MLQVCRRQTISSYVELATRSSRYNDFSIATSNVTATTSAIYVRSVARVSTTRLTWSGTRARIQVFTAARAHTRTHTLRSVPAAHANCVNVAEFILFVTISVTERAHPFGTSFNIELARMTILLNPISLFLSLSLSLALSLSRSLALSLSLSLSLSLTVSPHNTLVVYSWLVLMFAVI